MSDTTDYYTRQHKLHVDAARPYLDAYSETDSDQSHAYVRDAFAGMDVDMNDDTCRAAVLGAMWLSLHLHGAVSRMPAGTLTLPLLCSMIANAPTATTAAFTNAAHVEAVRRGPKVEVDFAQQTRIIRRWVNGKSVDVAALFDELGYWNEHMALMTALDEVEVNA